LTHAAELDTAACWCCCSGVFCHWIKKVKNGSGEEILLLHGCQLLSLKSAENGMGHMLKSKSNHSNSLSGFAM
jgi:hypothetical protein